MKIKDIYNRCTLPQVAPHPRQSGVLTDCRTLQTYCVHMHISVKISVFIYISAWFLDTCNTTFVILYICVVVTSLVWSSCFSKLNNRLT